MNRRLAGEYRVYSATKKLLSAGTGSDTGCLDSATGDRVPGGFCFVRIFRFSTLCVGLGTGSGAIALSLAHARPNWRVLAVDTSACLALRGRMKRCGCPQVEFLQ